MKVLLISPERKRKRDEAFLFKLGFLNLPYIAAVTPRDVEVKIVDEAYEDIDFDERVDLVGLTAQTPVAPRAYQISSEFRKREFPWLWGEYMPACYRKRLSNMWTASSSERGRLLAPSDRRFQKGGVKALLSVHQKGEH